MEHELVQYSLGEHLLSCTYQRSCSILKEQGGISMKMFNGGQKNTADMIFEGQIKPRLKEKDGFVHVIMINSFSKLCNQNFGCEDKYTTQIDEIITSIQMLGYEIVGIKVTTMQNQGLTGKMEGFNTLIMYR